MENVLDLKANIILGDDYKSKLLLPCWKGFQNRQGLYNSKDYNEISTGEVKVFITGNQIDYVKVSSQEQVNAIEFLFSNATAIRDVILTDLLNELPTLKEIYEDAIPDILNLSDFEKMIGLSIIHIMNSHKEGFAYVGYEFGCSWDEEHGLGIMTHKNNVIKIGQADTAFNPWITHEDNGTIKEEEEKWNLEHQHILNKRTRISKKPWWKFW